MSDTRRPVWVDVTILVLAGIKLVSMISLGTWQVRRLVWKLDLIEAVETRAYGDPIAAPAGAAMEYQRVFARGSFDHDKSLRVKAVTEIGPGFWIITPLITADGAIWINRGFALGSVEYGSMRQLDGDVEVTGLVRLNQPGGTLLERNQPDTGRWVSADVVEMSRAVGLDTAQTRYFIDKDASVSPMWPQGGMTRLTFRNTHLVYAVTWYTMAALFFVGMVFVARQHLTGADID